jgi:hypothetical protein
MKIGTDPHPACSSLGYYFPHGTKKEVRRTYVGSAPVYHGCFSGFEIDPGHL